MHYSVKVVIVLFRSCLRDRSGVCAKSTHGVLPDPGLCTVFSPGDLVLGSLLDQPRGNGRQDRTW